MPLFLTTPPAVYAWNLNTQVSREPADQIVPAVASPAPFISGIQESAGLTGSGNSYTGDSVNGKVDQASLYRLYVTPDDQAVTALAAGIGGPEDAYRTALNWIYVTDEKLNRDADHWLTPNEFLTGTPYNTNNPVQGKAASDCEEKANTLVSMIRAGGVPAEDIRVVLGEVEFDHVKTGHAWVELLTDGCWLVLDPCWGPYWNDRSRQLVSRGGVPFDYYTRHNYPALQRWVYYNDSYYLNLGDGAGNAPASWNHHGLDYGVSG